MHGGRDLPEFVAARAEIERHVKRVQLTPSPLTTIPQYKRVQASLLDNSSAANSGLPHCDGSREGAASGI